MQFVNEKAFLLRCIFDNLGLCVVLRRKKGRLSTHSRPCKRNYINILLENAFYNKKETEPQPENAQEEETEPEKVDEETIQNLLKDPNMLELLRKLSKTVGK